MIKPKTPYLPWEINEKDYPEKGGIEEQIKFLLGYSVLAPSTFNAQPWKCRLRDSKLQVLIDHKRVPTKSDITGRFALISIGCFLENFKIAANHFGWDIEIQFETTSFRDKDLLASVSLTRGHQSKESALFDSLTLRTTSRSLSKDMNLEPDIINEIRNLAEGQQEVIVVDKSKTEEVVAISLLGDMDIWTDIEFRKEHLSWTRNNLTHSKDGMPGFSVGIKTFPSFFAKKIILKEIFPKLQAKKNEVALKSSPNYVVLCSQDTEKEWIKVGMLFERISLHLTPIGLAASPMGQFIEADKARKQLKELIKIKEELEPQMFFRVGYPSLNTPHSPRRPVNEIMG